MGIRHTLSQTRLLLLLIPSSSLRHTLPFTLKIRVSPCFDGEGVYKLQKGDRIAQIVITPFAKLEPKEVGELSETKRGESGYGSSGR